MLVSSYYLSLTQRIDPNVTVAAWSITTVIERLVSGVTNTVRQVVIEPQFVGKTYLALFEHYTAKENAVPLGLYRRWDTKEHEDEEAGFVMSNPKPDVVSVDISRLLVLHRPPSSSVLLLVLLVLPVLLVLLVLVLVLLLVLLVLVLVLLLVLLLRCGVDSGAAAD